MKLLVLGTGSYGEVPENHAYRGLMATCDEDGAAEASLPVSLPPVMRRERKLTAMLSAAQAALRPLQDDPNLLVDCGMVVATRWDGRLGSIVDENSGAIHSFADLSPITIATSLVPHAAASWIPRVLHVGGPAVSIAAEDGLKTALALAATYLERGTLAMLVQETDLALPASVNAGFGPPADYSLSLLVSLRSWGKEIQGELTV